jgi:hypothetical protein
LAAELAVEREIRLGRSGTEAGFSLSFSFVFSANHHSITIAIFSSTHHDLQFP